MDMIFCLLQVQEKCIEQNMPLYMVFIDFSKAFDSLSRQGLWSVLKKYGCPDKFVNVVKSFHDGIQTSVTMYTSYKGFQVTNGVKTKLRVGDHTVLHLHGSDAGSGFQRHHGRSIHPN